MKYNTCSNSLSSPIPKTKDTSVENMSQNESSTNDKIEKPAINQLYRKIVSILNIESPQCFYVTCPEWFADKQRLTRDMKLFYSNKEQPKIDWEPSDKCAVLSIKQNAWYRAIILSVSSDTCVVFLKDIAVKETLPLVNIYPLDPSFLRVRDLAIRCSLAGIIPAGGTDKWPNIAIEFFQETVSKYVDFYIIKKGQVVDKTLPVNLYVTWEEISGPLDPAKTMHLLINKTLIERGVALPVKLENDDYYAFDEILDANDEKEDEMVPKSWLTPLPIKERYFKARATYVDHSGLIYLHPIKLKNYLEQIKIILNRNFLKSSPDPPHEWYPGQMCTAQYHLDKSYYRATILDTLPSGMIKIQFIDYGNEEECIHGDLRSDVILIDEPAVATRCKLHNIVPITSDGKWPISLLDKLHATIVDKDLDLEVMNQDTRTEDELLDLIVMLEGVNINMQLSSINWSSEEKKEIAGKIFI